MATIINSMPVWFGRGNMIKLNPTVHNYDSTSQGSTVSGRTDNGLYLYGTFIIPFEITMGTTKAVAFISGGRLYFSVIGQNSNMPTFSLLSTGDYSSQIQGYLVKKMQKLYYLRLSEYFDFEGRGDFYYYESADLFVLRKEVGSKITEMWVTSTGYVQFLVSPKTNYTLDLYRDSYYTEGESVKCSDNICPYQVAHTAYFAIEMSGTSNANFTIEVNTEQIGNINIQVNSGDTANDILSRISSTLRGYTVLNSNYIFTTTTSGNSIILRIEDRNINNNMPPHFWLYTRYGLTVNSQDWNYGTGGCYCSYYSASRVSCAYDGKKSVYNSSTSVATAQLSNSSGKYLVQVAVGDEQLLNYGDAKSIQHPLTQKCDGALNIGNTQSNKTHKKLLLYKQPIITQQEAGIALPTVPTVMGVKVDNKTLYAHFLPETFSGTGFEKVEGVKLRYTDTTLVGVNRATPCATVQPVPIIEDKVYTRCYSGNTSSYYWNNVRIHGFLTPLSNVTEIRCVIYEDGDNTSGTKLPNNSYPTVYFLSRSDFDDYNSTSSWQSILAISIPTPVQQRPHILSFRPTNPITVAQWVIVPYAYGSGYIRSQMYNYVTFVTNDGQSIDYKF